ncbi:MAG TPA: DNA-3-methyladenine glycosylase I [Candidatus Dormibacteraeota bacterium]|nr:DNA-3-methyladenine glycosylase I [Candidatus Dormibacteraeota bacterium]
MPDFGKQPRPPKELSGYLDAMARVMFQTGISWRVVEARWPGIQAAFKGFDPKRTSRLTTKDIDKLMGDTRVIRNRRKLEAIASNAGRMVELDTEYKGFKGYLDSLGDFDSTKKALHKDFAYMGDSGTWFFLWSVGRKVPEHK